MAIKPIDQIKTTDDIWSSEHVTVEKSLFQTRVPRRTDVSVHLIVVLLISAIAFGLAIYYAKPTL